MVDGLWILLRGVDQALSTSSTKRLNLVTRRLSDTRHSRFAKHSATRAATRAWPAPASDRTLRTSPRCGPSSYRPLRLCRQLQRRNGDHALFRRPQRGKAVIGVADDTGNQRRFKLDHHVPGHRHDVGAALVGGRQQDYRARFEQLIDFDRGRFSLGRVVRGNMKALVVRNGCCAQG